MIHESIKMVLISGASALFLFFVVLFYIFILKKKISLPILLLSISILPLVSMLRPGSYESGDLSIHSTFAMIFFNSLKEGIIIPAWHSYAVGGYGYPYFLFVYPLPYYLSSAIHILGFSFISSMKIVAALSFIASGYAMYLWIKEEAGNKLSGFIAGIFYLFAPYHLVDLHFRFAIGEILAFTFLPLTFYFLKKTENKSYSSIVFLPISVAGLIISHQAIAFVSSFFFMIYVIIFSTNKITFIKRMYGLILGALISSFYWLPMLMESRFTHLLDWKIYFYPVVDYLFTTSRYGLLYQGRFGELYFPIGYMHLTLIIISIFALFIKRTRIIFLKDNYKLFLFCIVLFFVSFFMMQRISAPIWDSFSILKGFQLTYRFSMFCALFSSAIAAIVLVKIKQKKLVYLIITITIIITILNWGNRKNVPMIDDRALSQRLLSSAKVQGEGTTVWANLDNLPPRATNLSFSSKNAIVKELSRTSIRHEYIIDVITKQANFVENTTYFPGWDIEVDGKRSEISKDQLANGLPIFTLNNGLHYVRFGYVQTTYQVLGRLACIFGLVSLLFGVGILKKSKK